MNQNEENQGRKLRRQDQFIDEGSEYKDEYDEGDVTGFMQTKPLPTSGTNSFNVSSNFLCFSLSATHSDGKTKLNVLMQFAALSIAAGNSWSQNRWANVCTPETLLREAFFSIFIHPKKALTSAFTRKRFSLNFFLFSHSIEFLFSNGWNIHRKNQEKFWLMTKVLTLPDLLTQNLPFSTSKNFQVVKFSIFPLEPFPSFIENDQIDLCPGYHYGPTGQQEYTYSSPPIYHPAPSGMKSIGIKDLFDIALTTLAFLSFGMFIVQVMIFWLINVQLRWSWGARSIKALIWICVKIEIKFNPNFIQNQVEY